MNVGAVFGIITAILVIVFVIMLGSGQVANMFCMGSVAQVNKAILNFEEVVDDIYSSAQGSSDQYGFAIPDGSSICFINTEDPRPNLDGGWRPDPNTYNVIAQEITLRGYNMWIEYNCGLEHEPGRKVDYMVVAESFCVTTGDTVYLENEGMTVGVEPLG